MMARSQVSGLGLWGLSGQRSAAEDIRLEALFCF